MKFVYDFIEKKVKSIDDRLIAMGKVIDKKSKKKKPKK